MKSKNKTSAALNVSTLMKDAGISQTISQNDLIELMINEKRENLQSVVDDAMAKLKSYKDVSEARLKALEDVISKKLLKHPGYRSLVSLLIDFHKEVGNFKLETKNTYIYYGEGYKSITKSITAIEIKVASDVFIRVPKGLCDIVNYDTVYELLDEDEIADINDTNNSLAKAEEALNNFNRNTKAMKYSMMKAVLNSTDSGKQLMQYIKTVAK